MAKQAWQSPGKAAAYRQSRDPMQSTRYNREDKIVSDWLADLPARAVVLDVPCGTGRFISLLGAGEFRYVGADFSLAMIKEARTMPGGRPSLGFVNADAELLPFRDNSVDCVIIWRFLHHIKDARVRQAILREAARVARSKVLASFYHSVSFTSLKRRVQRKIFCRKQSGGEITHWRLQREAEQCGLELVETKSFGKYRSINWFACLRK